MSHIPDLRLNGRLGRESFEYNHNKFLVKLLKNLSSSIGFNQIEIRFHLKGDGAQENATITCKSIYSRFTTRIFLHNNPEVQLIASTVIKLI